MGVRGPSQRHGAENARDAELLGQHGQLPALLRPQRHDRPSQGRPDVRRQRPRPRLRTRRHVGRHPVHVRPRHGQVLPERRHRHVLHRRPRLQLPDGGRQPVRGRRGLAALRLPRKRVARRHGDELLCAGDGHGGGSVRHLRGIPPLPLVGERRRLGAGVKRRGQRPLPRGYRRRRQARLALGRRRRSRRLPGRCPFGRGELRHDPGFRPRPRLPGQPGDAQARLRLFARRAVLHQCCLFVRDGHRRPHRPASAPLARHQLLRQGYSGDQRRR